LIVWKQPEEILGNSSLHDLRQFLLEKQKKHAEQINAQKKKSKKTGEKAKRGRKKKIR
jgi:hypothetical protein